LSGSGRKKRRLLVAAGLRAAELAAAWQLLLRIRLRQGGGILIELIDELLEAGGSLALFLGQRIQLLGVAQFRLAQLLSDLLDLLKSKLMHSFSPLLIPHFCQGYIAI